MKEGGARGSGISNGAGRNRLKAFRSFWILFYFAVLSAPVHADDASGRGANAALVAEIDARLQEPGLKGGFQGLIIQSLADGSVWYERNPDRLFLPASNQKLLVSAAALDLLGPDWRYTTTLLHTGRGDCRGTLRGDLYLKGSGDPLLEEKDLDALVEAVKKTGIRRVAGRVFGDDGHFDKQRYGDGWAWDDMPFYYSAPVSALNLNENVVVLRISPGAKAGDPARVTLSPPVKHIRVLVRATTAAANEKTTLRIRREIGREVITIEGTLAWNAPESDRRPVPVTVENPTLYAAAVLTERLRRAGIRVDREAEEGSAPQKEGTEIASHRSPPLSEILQRLNKPSDNLIAECLLKTLGAEKEEQGRGTFAAGRAVVTRWLRSIGVEEADIDMTDGSGLSRQNYVTPRALALLLRRMYSHPYAKVFLDSLPVAGVDGTLRNRMRSTPAEKNCRAKTGTLSRVSSLSGYVTTADGEALLFVILMNNHKAPRAVSVEVQNEIVARLAGWTKQSKGRARHVPTICGECK